MADRAIKVSETFRDVVTSGGGTPVQTCACGKTYFATGPGAASCYDSGEQEALEAKAEKEPGKYIPAPYDSVGFACFGGQTFVYECEDCPVMEKYERFIWSERRRIIEYIKRRIAEEKAAADEGAVLMEGLDV